MSREEYIVALGKELQFLQEENRAAALAFYTEMLDDRIEDGMDEESAVSAMERPADIAARLRAERGEEGPAPLHVGMQDEAMEFSTLADSVLRRVQQAIDGIPAGLHLPQKPDAPETPEMPKMPEMPEIPEAPQRPEASDMPERVGDYQRQVFLCPADALRAVRLEVADMPVSILPAADDQVRLVYYTNDRNPYQAQVEHGVLILRSEETAGNRGFNFSFFSNGLRLIWNQPAPMVELAVPPDALIDLFVRTSNGSIRAEGLHALCAVEAATSNSRIRMRNITCKSLSAKTSNSRLELDRVTAKQFLTGKTANARIEAVGLRAGEPLVLTTSNGRLNAEDLSAPALKLISSNGSILVGSLAARAIEIRTSNGNIRGTLPGAQADWAIQSSTSNGHNSLPRSQAGPLPLTARTSNGNIDLSFEG
ncbi:MAG: DUF4097 family beta strand repeat protein [Clostridia bacterium]|nr:DUF4097 family beta strand repeat protein [Clostridia bacterium]